MLRQIAQIEPDSEWQSGQQEKDQQSDDGHAGWRVLETLIGGNVDTQVSPLLLDAWRSSGQMARSMSQG
jgi:hypothetical protein